MQSHYETLEESLAKIPDDNIGKQILLKILYGPKAPVEELEREAREFEKQLLAEWAEEDRLKAKASKQGKAS